MLFLLADEVVEAGVAEVLLVVGHLVVGDGEKTWGRERETLEMTRHGDESVVLDAISAFAMDVRSAIIVNDTCVNTIASGWG